MTMSDLAEEEKNDNRNLNDFLNNLKIQGATERTLQTYGYVLKGLEKTIEKSCYQVTQQDVNTYLLKYTVNTRNHHAKVLKSFFRFANIDNISIPKIKTRPVLRKVAEYETTSNLPLEGDQQVVSLLIRSGIRRDEVSTIRDLDKEKWRFTVIGKGEKPRRIFLFDVDKKLRDFINSYNKPENDESVKTQWHKWTIGKVSWHVEAVAKKNEVDLAPHMLRRGFAREANRRGFTIADIQRMLGHANIKTTAGYIDPTEKDIEDKINTYGQAGLVSNRIPDLIEG